MISNYRYVSDNNFFFQYMDDIIKTFNPVFEILAYTFNMLSKVFHMMGGDSVLVPVQYRPFDTIYPTNISINCMASVFANQ